MLVARNATYLFCNYRLQKRIRSFVSFSVEFRERIGCKSPRRPNPHSLQDEEAARTQATADELSLVGLSEDTDVSQVFDKNGKCEHGADSITYKYIQVFLSAFVTLCVTGYCGSYFTNDIFFFILFRLLIIVCDFRSVLDSLLLCSVVGRCNTSRRPQFTVSGQSSIYWTFSGMNNSR